MSNYITVDQGDKIIKLLEELLATVQGKEIASDIQENPNVDRIPVGESNAMRLWYDNPDLNNLIIPVGFFYNGNDNNDNDNDNMKLLNKLINSNKTIDDDLYNKLYNLADNNVSKNKTKKTKLKKSKTKKNINKNKNKNKNKKTKKMIKLKK